MSTRDKLLIDLQAALNRRDWIAYNEIIDALIDMDERDGRKSEWEKQGKEQSASNHSNLRAGA
jgi:hypothetical protein